MSEHEPPGINNDDYDESSEILTDDMTEGRRQ